ncbi:hypothetical protein IV203_022033 [Nitzschia inconspicua]|uniref:Uncharacterized protein n=1 Tax=Nitzschia inconspicua TaxID=303405 RepID=A0A9K3KIU3_9STRA|nr:hypothetical protein IV203_022033 [Nitzschia inconspicua]
MFSKNQNRYVLSPFRNGIKEEVRKFCLVLSTSPSSSSSSLSNSSSTAGESPLQNETIRRGLRQLNISKSATTEPHHHTQRRKEDDLPLAIISNRSCSSQGPAHALRDNRNDDTSSPWGQQRHPVTGSKSPRRRSRSESPTSLSEIGSGRRRNPLPNFHWPSSRLPGCGHSRVDDGDYRLKNARDVMEGSISAVINYLKIAGVPKPSTDQLERNLEMGRWYATMVRSMDYIQCVDSHSEDDLLAKVHLVVNAWESLCRYKALEYKRAYKHAYRLRYESKDGRHNSINNNNNNHHRSRNAITIYNSNVNDSPCVASVANPSKIKEAIEQQISVAEQCTSCQKKLYVVLKWQCRVLQRTKRAAAIEPQGYKPILCL